MCAIQILTMAHVGDGVLFVFQFLKRSLKRPEDMGIDDARMRQALRSIAVIRLGMMGHMG